MSRELIPPPSETGRLRAIVWAAAALLLFVPGIANSRLPRLGTFRLPRTPVDLVWDRHARLWSFLKEARDYVPAGQTYTLIARDREDEMYLYMFSLGLFEKQIALPSSYFGNPVPDGQRARFILAYDLGPATSDRLVAQVDHGAVYERVERRP